MEKGSKTDKAMKEKLIDFRIDSLVYDLSKKTNDKKALNKYRIELNAKRNTLIDFED